ncbi:ATP-grasp domain-containing protein [Sphingomonas sp. Root241]|uniref:ATP-grasp domain-containing protein n=1 Tax=Sphingomonas sp. Root241 TaxID=1736501 RepID=UPI0006F6F8BC|nr:ATP-grasp domain-containing protein [Sphingomonas sp. Root241]KRC81717.1 hypothetical protein ASE13_04900 [Sphingomonas sp. Root241]
MKSTNILVTGVAGDIGFGAGRILRDWEWRGVLWGADIHANHAGTRLFDGCPVAPRAADPAYLGWLGDFVTANRIGLVLPTSEAEIHALDRTTEIAGARILSSSREVVRYGLDKHACLDFLDGRGVAVPEHGLVGQDVPTRFPVIVKPRSGQGSKGLRRIDTPAELDAIEAGALVWQAYLTPDDAEYTCAVFCTREVPARIMVMRRKLQGGFTGSGEVVDDPAIHQYVARIAEVLSLDGVMNVQLRRTAAGPLLFEINPRLSSTLVFRDKLGFHDLRWWIAAALGEPVPPYLAPATGTRFFRGVQEYILPPT